MKKKEQMSDKEIKKAMEQIKQAVRQRYTITKLERFENYMGNLAMFILAPLIIIMSPLIILAEKSK